MPLALWEKKDKKFKEELSDKFEAVCALLSKFEKDLFDSRAEILATKHPLSLQVDLRTGVANGVLVVRSADDAAKLLAGLLCGTLEFQIEHEGEPGQGVTVLTEMVSGCPFRAVTDYAKLTNSFWNFWGLPE